jgi:predicted  nucleic acid-binding Zn-ribbon protein
VHVSDDPDREQLRGLLQLQQADSRIRRLRHQLDDLPEQQQLDEVEQRAGVLQEEHDRLRIDLDRIGAAQRKLEGEIELLRQRRDAEHARMYSGDISNPKELQSLRAEIDATERRIGDNEDKLLEVMEKLEEYEGKLGEVTGEQEQLGARAEELTAARDEASQGLLAEVAELEVERDRQRAGVPEEHLARYDDKLAQSGGVAVGELVEGMCTACRIELPYAEVQRLLDGPPLATCPQCRRLLVVAA